MDGSAAGFSWYNGFHPGDYKFTVVRREPERSVLWYQGYSWYNRYSKKRGGVSL